MNTPRLLSSALAALTALLATTAALGTDAAAAPPPPSAVFERLSWHTLSAELTFVVKREGKSPLSRTMRVRADAEGDRQRLLATFSAPANMCGTAFLAHANPGGEDDYYLYVRTLRRVKRVPRDSDNFMLRDFMSLYFLKPRTDLWRFTWEEGAAAAEGQAVLRGTPKSPDVVELTGYAGVRHHVDLATLRIVATDFLDASGAVIRRQRVTAFTESKGVSFPSQFETEDTREGARAELIVKSLELDEPLSEDMFTVRALKRR